jgi:hypothetical protein
LRAVQQDGGFTAVGYCAFFVSLQQPRVVEKRERKRRERERERERKEKIENERAEGGGGGGEADLHRVMKLFKLILLFLSFFLSLSLSSLLFCC